MQFENVIFKDSIGFQCKNCGVCCKDQPPDINSKEQEKIETKGFTNFLEDPNNPRNRNIRRKEDGSCFFLTKENTCNINDVKPAVCILEPFIITDFDFRTNTIFLDLNPLAVNNCKGIFAGKMINMEEIAKTAQNIVKEFSEIVAKRTGLPITDQKVASITRKLLIESQSFSIDEFSCASP
jgi:Fe-S-cluster containining protein